MTDKLEELRRKEVDLQKKQLAAQRVTAAAALASAANTAQTAEAMEKMRREANAAAEATARHRRDMRAQQRELAKQQSEAADEQRLAAFRQTVLTAVPALGPDEKTQYLVEQLTPRIAQQFGKQKPVLHFSTVLSNFEFFAFADKFFANDPAAIEFQNRDCTIRVALKKAKVAFNQALKASKKTPSQPPVAFLATTAAVVSIIPTFLGIYYVFKAFFPGFAEEQSASLNNVLMPILLLGTVLAPVVVFSTVKRLFKARAFERENMAGDVAELQAKFDEAAEAFQQWLRKRSHSWSSIKKRLVDLYLNSPLGRELQNADLFSESLIVWRNIAISEQSFLPPSARISVEDWTSVFYARNESEISRAKERQLNIRSLLLARLSPSSRKRKYEVSNLNQDFIDLDLHRKAARTSRASSSEES